MKLFDFLVESSRGFGTRAAVVDVAKSTTLTYEELWGKVDLLSKKMSEFGLTPGDAVVIALQNGADWIVSFLASLKCGANIVPIRLSATSSDIKSIINLIKPSLFISESGFVNRSLPFNLLCDDQRVIIASKKMMGRGTVQRINYFDEAFMESFSDRGKFDLDRTKQTDLVSTVFTYRGFGYPLGAMLSNKNYIEGLKGYVSTAGFYSRHVFLAALPFYYSYPLVGTVLAPLVTGSTIVIARGIQPIRLLDIIEKYEVDVLTGVPSLYSVLALGSTQKNAVGFAFSGGSAMEPDVFERVQSLLGVNLRQGYGLTECLAVSCNPKKNNKPATLGLPLVGAAGLAIDILNEAGEKIDPGQVGEIVISGSTVMRGYYRMPTETATVLRDGKLHTGDLGQYDNDGHLVFNGVRKRIAKVGGNIVDLAEVEKRLLGISDVSYAYAYGIPDSRWGQVVAADIRMTGDLENPRSIQQKLKEYLSSYKIPKVIKILT